MKRSILAIAVLVFLAGCEEHYRYPCQNPDNFQHPDCQKPKCLFTQMCPEYLVAPILEKQLPPQNADNASQPAKAKPQPPASADR